MNALRQAFRSLRATPLVSAVAILSLALGIGANTAIFSIVDALILRSLPVEHAERLVILKEGELRTSWTNPIWEAIRARPDLFDGAMAVGAVGFNASEAGEVDVVDGSFVSAGYFDVLGVRPARGRFFTADDDRRGGGADGPVVVISHALWQSRFGGAEDVIGKPFTLSRVTFTIVGVAPPEFFGDRVGRRVDAWTPLGTEPLVRGTESYLDRRSTWWMQVFARLKPGQTAEAATAALRGAQPGIREETVPPDYRPEDMARYLSEPLSLVPASAGMSSLRNRYQRPLLALSAVVAFTLLIACGNIANLLLARASARRHEFAVRTALGASRWRVARQLIGENLLLSALGAAFGILFALWGSQLIVNQIAGGGASRITLDIGLDLRMLGFTGLVALTTTLLFGIAPTMLATRIPPMDAMKEQGRGSSSGRHVGLASSLIVAQVSLSLILLVAAGLFVRTFVSLAQVDLGFAPERVLVMNVGAQRTGVEPSQRGALYERLRETIATVPGVTNAALSVITPVSGSQWNGDIVFPEKPDLPVRERIVNFNYISSGWLATMGTPILAGRDFGSADRVGTGAKALVNQKFADKYFDGASPLGKIVRTADYPSRPGKSIEIVGLVGDAVYTDLREPLSPTMYFALAQDSTAGSTIVVSARTSTPDPRELTRAVTAAVAGVHPDFSVSFRSLQEFVDGALTQERLIAMLSGFFGVLALLLAALGLYGITSYSVIRRRAELGIRLALGSSPGALVRLVMSRTGALVLAGILIGGVAAWWASRFVATLLFGLTPTDPVTIVGAMAVLAVVAALAGWLPARRAAVIDPAEVLREG